MLGDDITRKNLEELYAAFSSGDNARIEKAKYEVLLDCSNLLELVINYLFLGSKNITFDFGTSIIKKGTKLYRIRDYQENVDFSDSLQWLPPPSRPQNRANRAGQSALYLASKEEVCLMETHIRKGQKYVIATYECIDDIELGGFFSLSKTTLKHNIAGIVLNAFLIAPSRSDKNSELFAFLDGQFGNVQLDDIVDWQDNLYLPFKFAVLNKRDQYYKLTNQVCDILRKQYPDGIRYSSCYIPVETLGISCSDYNVVLYEKGISKITFLNYEVKTDERSFTEIDAVKCFCNKA